MQVGINVNSSGMEQDPCHELEQIWEREWELKLEQQWEQERGNPRERTWE